MKGGDATYLARASRALRRAVKRARTASLRLRLPRQIDRIDALREEDDWLLVVLDACRYDRFVEQYDDYVSGTVEPVRAAGANTFDYVRRNWPGTYDLPYVTGAAPITAQELDFSREEVTAQGLYFRDDELERIYDGYVPADHLTDIVEVWRTAWDEELGVCPPEPVTDAAVARASATDRMVVHYFQPHAPYIGSKRELGDLDCVDDEGRLKGGAIMFGIWQRARRGELSREELLALYDANLRRVLPEVGRLVHRTDFERVVVVGDHGEALGEYGTFAHEDEHHPKVRTVPWCVVDGVEELALPERDEVARPSEVDGDGGGDVASRLADLGYL